MQRPTAVFAVLVGLALGGCARDEQNLTAPRNQAPSAAAAAEQQPDLRLALAVHGRHTMRLITLPGVVGTAVGVRADGRPVIRILTKRTGVVGLPQNLEGIPVEVQVTGELYAASCSPTMYSCSNTDVWPTPVPIGVSTGNVGQCESGTIGARVKAGAAVYALSNNHVYALENTAPLNSNVVQPGLTDTQPQCSASASDVIGTLFAFATIAFCGSTCPNNTIDAAIAASSATNLDNMTAPAGYGVPNSVVVTAAVGLSVQKYGRSTSLTTGQVTGVDATVMVGYNSGIAQFVHQILVGNCPTTCTGRGDSGSLWVTNDASANPVGLLFAGNSDGSVAIANRISDVLTYFGVTVDATAHPTASGGVDTTTTCGPYGFGGTTVCGSIIAVAASGSNAIAVSYTDPRYGNRLTGTLTLSGATASGGVDTTTTCGPYGFGGTTVCGSIISVVGSGNGWIRVSYTDPQYGARHIGYIKLS
jgi:hypothetical protein